MHESSVTSDDLGKKYHRRPWLILGGLVLLLLGVLAWLLLYYDGPPPDDEHLMPKWSDRSGDKNPLAVFCKTLIGSSISDWEKIPEKSRDLNKKPTPAARAFVTSHAAEIAAFHALLLTDPNTWQWPDVSNMGRYESPFSSRGATECQILSLVLRSRASQLCEDGKVEEASTLCLEMARWADGLSGAEGSTYHLLLTQGIQFGAMSTLHKILRTNEVSPAMLRDTLQQLQALKGQQTEQYQKAIKVDYAWFKDCVGKLSKRDLMSIGSLPRPFELLSPRFFKRNQTLALRVQLDTPVVTALDHGWKDALPVMEARTTKVDHMYEPYSRWFFMNPNFVGQSHMLHDIPLPRIRHSLNRREELILLGALRLHEIEHGSLPSTLDVLVPPYLPTIPKDVITGTPFLWNAKLRVLYTVGSNGKDDGGSINEKYTEKGMDWGMRYPWGEGGTTP